MCSRKILTLFLLSHSLHLMTLGGKFAGITECMKQFLDFKRLSAGFPVQRVGFVCFLFGLFYSITYISSDARWRNSRQQVQFFYISWFETSVIARHALLSSESSLYACAGLAHTEAAYSVTG